MKSNAFSRLELLMTVGTVSLLTVVGGSLCADTRERSQSIVCMNNLRQIGRAFHAWAAEHDGHNAWWVPPADGGYYQLAQSGTPSISVSGIGTFPSGIINNAWFHYLWVSEYLPSPDILVCPADAGKSRASKFSAGPAGLAHPSMQNRSCSYLVGVDALRERPLSLLSADRSIIAQPGSSSCSSGITSARSLVSSRGDDVTGWTDALHPTSGHGLLNDGRVARMSARELNTVANSRAHDSFAYHILLP